MYCGNCGAELTVQTNFCPYCGAPLREATDSISLLNKASSTARSVNRYSLILVSAGTCDAVTAGDLLEDVFGYTDAESSNLIRMVPVVVGENLTAEEAATVAQMYTEYGMEVSVIDEQNRFVDLSAKANRSVFDSNGALLSGAAAIIGALTVSNRIRAYRRFRRPPMVERIFRVHYRPVPPVHIRRFRPFISLDPMPPRRVIRKPDPLVRYGAGGLGIDMNRRRAPGGPGAPRRTGGPAGQGAPRRPGGPSGPGTGRKQGGPSGQGGKKGPGGTGKR